MKINSLRRLDYWIGIPLCFLFSILERFLRIIPRSNKINSDPPKKILFIKLSELGAIILAFPLLNSVRQRYPSARIFFVTFSKNKDIFSVFNGLVSKENVLGVSEDNLWSFAIDIIRLIVRLRREKIDIAFDLDFFSRFTALFTYLSTAGKRIGFSRYTYEGLYRGSLGTHQVLYNPLNHISRSYMSFLQVISEDKKNSPELGQQLNESAIVFPEYHSLEQKKKEVKDWLRSTGVKTDAPLLLINPGEGVLPVREWPLDNFVALSKMLLARGDMQLGIIGTQGAFVKADSLINALGSQRCFNLVGKTELAALMELFCLAQGIISNDCGLAHLAMLTPIRKFIIFGPESPRVFGPLAEHTHVLYSEWPCSPCLSVLNHRNSACKDNMCLRAISPEQAYGVIRNNL